MLTRTTHHEILTKMQEWITSHLEAKNPRETQLLNDAYDGLSKAIKALEKYFGHDEF